VEILFLLVFDDLFSLSNVHQNLPL
jgi:hypothetical protein